MGYAIFFSVAPSTHFANKLIMASLVDRSETLDLVSSLPISILLGGTSSRATFPTVVDWIPRKPFGHKHRPFKASGKPQVVARRPRDVDGGRLKHFSIPPSAMDPVEADHAEEERSCLLGHPSVTCAAVGLLDSAAILGNQVRLMFIASMDKSSGLL